MSGVAKTIGKVFSKIGDVVKKVAAPLLAIGAIVFTGGAALGLAPLAGGWGGAVASGLGALGAPTGGVLASVLTQAGTGAALGGLTSLATGNDFAQGAALGATGGALTGGISGMIGSGVTAAASSAPNLSGPMTMSTRNLTAAAGIPQAAAVAPTAPVAATTAAPVVAAAPATATVPTAQGVVSKALGGIGKFISSEGGGQIVGNTISGIGQGLLSGMAAKDEAQALEDQQQRITDSYDIKPGALGIGAMADGGRPTAEQQYGRSTARQRREWRYDRDRREIVRS